ncbi:MAG: hypothetical protein AB8C13_10850 [Phycisphaerales bacterium]
MKKIAVAAVIAAAGIGFSNPVYAGGNGDPQEASYTYQGVLEFQGERVSGMRDFKFSLWNKAEVGEGDRIAPEIIRELQVEDGLFRTEFDEYGQEIWEGFQTWIQIEIRDPDTGDFVIVGERSKITSTPYAITILDVYNRRDFLRIGDGTNNKSLYVPNGRVGIGTTNPQDQLDVRGIIRSEGVRLIGGADIAEPFDVNADVPVLPGMIVAIDPANPGELMLSTSAYNHRVAGIISGANGINPALTLAQTGTIADGEHPVALTGRVWCYVDADANGPIVPGDMLTTSDTQGHAMKVDDRSRAFGATIGKAMTSLEEGQGLVLVLVNLQ